MFWYQLLLRNIAKLRNARGKLDHLNNPFLDESFDPPVSFCIKNAQLNDLNHLTDQISLNKNHTGFMLKIIKLDDQAIIKFKDQALFIEFCEVKNAAKI